MNQFIKRMLCAVICAAMLLAVAGCAKEAGDPTQNTTQPTTEPAKIDVAGKVYWNVDRERFASDANISRQAVNGAYEIRFDCDGQRVVLPFKDKALVDQVDTMSLLSFETDAQGIVVKIIAPKEVAGAKIVKSVSGKKIVCTANATASGTTVDLPLTDDTKILSTSFDGAALQNASALKTGTPITAITDESGAVTHIFILGEPVPTGKEAHCEACDQTVIWTPWDGSTMKDGGHYYLENHIDDLDETIAIKKNTTVTLDLNGKDITSVGEDAVRLIEIYGTLHLVDSAETDGTLSSEIQKMAPVFYVKDGVFNLYGGTLRGSSFTRSGTGSLGEDGCGILNMYGGTITGGSATGGNGGNIEMFHDSILNLYGGTISNGSASKNGGNIHVGKTGKLNIMGGTITGGSATLGGGVYAQGSVTVGGSAQVNGNKDSDLYLVVNQSINIDNLNADAKIGATLKDSVGQFAVNAKQEDAACFVVAEGLTVQFEEGKLILVQGS